MSGLGYGLFFPLLMLCSMSGSNVGIYACLFFVSVRVGVGYSTRSLYPIVVRLYAGVRALVWCWV